jgi:hypothetical protein
MTLHGHLQSDVAVPDSSALAAGDVLLITNENMTRTH